MKDIGKRVQNMPTIADLDARFRVMDEFGDYTQVLSLPAPPIEAMGTPEQTPEIARVANDGFAELCRKYPDRFLTFLGGLPMNNPDAAVKEMDRCVNDLRARRRQ